MLRNSGPDLAFMIRLRLIDGDSGPDITPVYWQDNYISLLPGEAREIRVAYPLPAGSGKKTMLDVGGWNVRSITIVPANAQHGWHN
jgi:exo-1,4-beta-D-glucosaminidase